MQISQKAVFITQKVAELSIDIELKRLDIFKLFFIIFLGVITHEILIFSIL